MRTWTRIPRAVRDRATGVLPHHLWVWLHELREVAVDRRWSGATALRYAYPELTAGETGLEALRRAELRVFSQNGEDGVLAYLLHRIGVASRRVAEFGIGDGQECCSANLLITFGWSGLLMDADADSVSRARRFFDSRGATQERLAILHRAVDVNNVDRLLREHIGEDLDVLSLDIDGNDYWVFEAITVRPRIVVIEYNASFGPERAVTIPYTPAFDRYQAHPSGFYHGASIAALARLAERKGYMLVGCDSRGVNAFLVDREAAAGRVEEVPPAVAFASLYERSHLALDDQFRQIAHLPLVEVGD